MKWTTPFLLLAALAACRGVESDVPVEHSAPVARKHPVPPMPVEPVWVKDEGHLRHAHWLASREGELRWATAAHSAVIRTEQPWVADVFDTSVVEIHGPAGLESRLEVPFLLLASCTWRSRPTWRVLEMEGVTWVVCLDRSRGQLHVFDLESGAEVSSALAARELFDTRSVEGGFEVLVAVDDRLELITLLPSSESIVRVRPLETGLESLSVAAFATLVPGSAASKAPALGVDGDTAREVWAAGWTATELSLVLASDASRGPAPRSVSFASPTPRNSSLRLDAASDGERTWLALAEPGYESGVGRVLLAAASEGAFAVMYAGRIDPDVVGGWSDQRDWGQCVVFVPDADGDGVPDLVVAGPSSAFNVQVDLVSIGSWTRLTSYHSEHFQSSGHWLDVSPDGRLVLVGGASARSEPENLHLEGYLAVLNAVDLGVHEVVEMRPMKHER